MSDTEKQFQNELNSLDVKMQKEVYDEAMGKAFLSSVQKIEHPEIAILKKRVSELEQQLKTAKADGVREAAKELPSAGHLDSKMTPVIYIKLNDLVNYASKLEQGEG